MIFIIWLLWKQPYVSYIHIKAFFLQHTAGSQLFANVGPSFSPLKHEKGGLVPRRWETPRAGWAPTMRSEREGATLASFFSWLLARDDISEKQLSQVSQMGEHKWKGPGTGFSATLRLAHRWLSEAWMQPGRKPTCTHRPGVERNWTEP